MTNNFISPQNVTELCKVLKNKERNTYLLAGGTDLCIKFTKEGIFDFEVIDISKIHEFKNIEENEESIAIGACVTMTELESSSLIKRYVPALSDAAYSLGSTQIRNRATIGGNLANAAQCGDTIHVLFAYDADVIILNSNMEYRNEKVRNLITGIGKTTLCDDEVITKIIIKKSDFISSFAKVGSRKTVTISKINCCGKFDFDADGKIKDVEIYMGAVGIKPIKAVIVEKELCGKKMSEILSSCLSEAVQMQIEEAIPNRDSKHYKKISAYGIIEDMLNDLGGGNDKLKICR